VASCRQNRAPPARGRSQSSSTSRYGRRSNGPSWLARAESSSVPGVPSVIAGHNYTGEELLGDLVARAHSSAYAASAGRDRTRTRALRVMLDRCGQYQLVRELGRGAAAIVYEAEHVALGKRVAIKILHPSLVGDARCVARFAREARLVASLRHPHIAEVYDTGFAEGGLQYLVLELAERGNLAALIAERRPLAIALALELLIPVASGLSHAHERGIVHRDIKPANILLALDRAGTFVPKICDFGIGKSGPSSDSHLTAQGAILGTLAYMPPEQLRDSSTAGPAADQYALGAILYEAVTGQLPYERDATVEWMNAILAGGVAAPSHLRSELPVGFDDVLLRALHVHPEARHASVKEFAAQLLRFTSGRTWTTWASEFGVVRDGAACTADDETRAHRAFASPLARPSSVRRMRGVGVRWAMLGGALGVGFAAGWATREPSGRSDDAARSLIGPGLMQRSAQAREEPARVRFGPDTVEPETSAVHTVEPEQPTLASGEPRAAVTVERQASLSKAPLGLDVALTKSRRVAESRSVSVDDAGARERLNVALPAGSERSQVFFGNNRAPVLE
jgi:eukaryotic-like serine/threonine-protein kinase